jgi:4-carboxymuconolactone decarboxylase
MRVLGRMAHEIAHTLCSAFAAGSSCATDDGRGRTADDVCETRPSARRRQEPPQHDCRTVPHASSGSLGRISLRYDARLRHAGETPMVERELYQQGEAIRRQLRGDADFMRNKREYDKDPVMKKFIDVATETVFGALWSRPGLDFKTRTLICVVSDAATGRHPELDIHLRLALKQGWSDDELVEVLLHLSGYVGVPLIREAMLVASRVFAEVKAERAALP